MDHTCVCSDLTLLLGALDDMDDFERSREYVNQIKVHLVVLRDLRQKITWIQQEQKCLGFNVSEFKNVEDVENWVYPFFHLIKVCMNIKRLLHYLQASRKLKFW